MKVRTWRWLQARVAGLFNLPPTVTPAGVIIPATRIQYALEPPKRPPKHPGTR